MAFNRKKIRIILKLDKKDQSFTSDNKNKLSAVGLRISAEIVYGYGSPAPYCRVKIYGLPQETMSKLISVKWLDSKALQNTITLESAEGEDDFVRAFSGGIVVATPDYSEAPNVAIVIEAISAAFESKSASPAESYTGQVPVTDIISGICNRIGFSFENNGVSAVVENQYLSGSDIEKIRWLCIHNNIDLYLGSNSVAITQKGQPRKGRKKVISPKTGMIGYPTLTSIGVNLKCLYDPSVEFGRLVTVKDSVITAANRDWRIYGIRAQLETEMDSGRWFMELIGSNLNDGVTHVAR